jgi:hypothetical protein
MKVAVKHPIGLEIEFEGDAEAFEAFTRFYDERLNALLEASPPVSPPAVVPPKPSPPTPSENAPDDRIPLDPRAIAARLEEVGAKTDIERVTVMAQAAVDSGLEGLDYDAADNLFLELNLRRPPKWRPTFSNARTRGYLKNVERGLWAPTVVGTNFALLGDRGKRPRTKAGQTERFESLPSTTGSAEP